MSNALETKEEAERGVVLTAEVLQQQEEDQELSEVTDLTLRDLRLISVGNAFLQTPCLEVLSLSHNRIVSLEGFQHLRSLQYLNLNFNRIASLCGIEACKQLRQIFLSSNSVSDLEPLAGCPLLQTAVLLGNQVASLDALLFTLTSLRELSELDLSGNPVATSPAYKHRLVLELRSLRSLDGEPIGPSDAEVAERFLERNSEYRPDSGEAPQAAEVPSPPAGEQYRSGTPPRPGEAAPQPLRPPTDRPPSAGLPKPQDVQLFRSEFLSNHPILLEYVIEKTISSRPGSARPGSARPTSASLPDGSSQHSQVLKRSASGNNSSPRPGSSGGRRRSFVDRLRTMAASSPDQHGAEGDAGVEEGEAAMCFRSELEEELLDPGAALTPQQTIRRLLQICEQLEEERDAAENALKAAHGRQGSVLSWGETEAVVRQLEKLTAENKRLSIENKNMYILLEENRLLKSQLSGQGGDSSS